MAAAGRANAKRAVFYPNAIPGKRQSGAIDRFFDSSIRLLRQSRYSRRVLRQLRSWMQRSGARSMDCGVDAITFARGRAAEVLLFDVV
ncbi:MULTISPECIES: hypothetical protein [Burkholderia]|uniref:hypothetical protein n=1 Tax=Burkholderia TaxID=32008 RepID=UPI001160D0B8|nr:MULTISPECIES: hypothetical protein [Burkholderia]